jgi:hypothetical protein
MSQPQQKKAESPVEQVSAMDATPRPEHRWLQRLVGDWTFEVEERPASGEPSGTSHGSERVRTLGEIWVLAEGQGEMPGGSIGHTLMSLGFDPVRRRFIGTWIGSMMTHMWVYDGTLDAEGRVLSLESDGPSMTGDGTTSRYRDAIEFRHDNERTLTASVRQPDGSWQTFMVATYRRAGTKA